MTVEITASVGTLGVAETFPIEIEVPNENAEDKETLNQFICDYLNENEAEVKEWVLPDNQETEIEMEVPF